MNVILDFLVTIILMVAFAGLLIGGTRCITRFLVDDYHSRNPDEDRVP